LQALPETEFLLHQCLAVPRGSRNVAQNRAFFQRMDAAEKIKIALDETRMLGARGSGFAVASRCAGVFQDEFDAL
jgi:hypothetical protein